MADREAAGKQGIRAKRSRQETGPDPFEPIPWVIDLGCCGVCAVQLGAPGLEQDLDPGFRSTDQTVTGNVLIVAGRITESISPLIRCLHAKLSLPGRVIAVGTCAISGALLNTIPLQELVPVDLCIPGCPPHPAALAGVLACFRKQGIA
jgi:NADH-quinone oxidoreductase subunit B